MGRVKKCVHISFSSFVKCSIFTTCCSFDTNEHSCFSSLYILSNSSSPRGSLPLRFSRSLSKSQSVGCENRRLPRLLEAPRCESLPKCTHTDKNKNTHKQVIGHFMLYIYRIKQFYINALIASFSWFFSSILFPLSFMELQYVPYIVIYGDFVQVYILKELVINSYAGSAIAGITNMCKIKYTIFLTTDAPSSCNQTKVKRKCTSKS